MTEQYIADIIANNGTIPPGWHEDPYPMQIAKLDDALRKAEARK